MAQQLTLFRGRTRIIHRKRRKNQVKVITRNQHIQMENDRYQVSIRETKPEPFKKFPRHNRNLEDKLSHLRNPVSESGTEPQDLSGN